MKGRQSQLRRKVDIRYGEAAAAMDGKHRAHEFCVSIYECSKADFLGYAQPTETGADKTSRAEIRSRHVVLIDRKFRSRLRIAHDMNFARALYWGLRHGVPISQQDFEKARLACVEAIVDVDISLIIQRARRSSGGLLEGLDERLLQSVGKLFRPVPFADAVPVENVDEAPESSGSQYHYYWRANSLPADNAAGNASRVSEQESEDTGAGTGTETGTGTATDIQLGNDDNAVEGGSGRHNVLVVDANHDEDVDGDNDDDENHAADDDDDDDDDDDEEEEEEEEEDDDDDDDDADEEEEEEDEDDDRSSRDESDSQEEIDAESVGDDKVASKGRNNEHDGKIAKGDTQRDSKAALFRQTSKVGLKLRREKNRKQHPWSAPFFLRLEVCDNNHAVSSGLSTKYTRRCGTPSHRRSDKFSVMRKTSIAESANFELLESRFHQIPLFRTPGTSLPHLQRLVLQKLRRTKACLRRKF